MIEDDIFDTSFLCNFNDKVKTADIPYEALRRIWENNNDSKRIIADWMKLKNSCLDDEPISGDEEGKQLICNAIDLLLTFIQHNFTGPLSDCSEISAAIEQSASKDDNNDDPFVKLMENGEEINPNVKLGELFVIAKRILSRLLRQWPESLVLNWWRLRVIVIHQNVLDELTNNLYENLKEVTKILDENISKLHNTELEGLLYLELINAYLLFRRPIKTEEFIEKLCKHLKVSVEVQSFLGLRTKFQTKPLPQLCLRVTQTSESLSSSKETNASVKLPKLLLLDDDTRLERIQFIRAEDNEIMSLPSVLQALVLAKVKHLKLSQPKDRLADEELEPFIQTLLYQENGPLQVRQSSLLLNCIQESTHRRTIERSWKQCEEAVNLLSDTSYTLQERLSYGFASFLQPTWQVQMQLCQLLRSLGMVKTALDIYLKIQAWTEVIECYTLLELRHKAAETIRQELDKKSTVLLYCLLGDATDDPQCYEKAWQFSKETSARAQAHWGNYHFRRAEYSEAIPHLRRSVEINALQEGLWLRLGFAAISVEDWKLAVHAYITYTHLEAQSFESWNNLSKALIKLGDLQRAHKVLSESLKCNYGNWKVWENFLLVSVDTGHFEDALNAYSRLAELKDRYIDLEVLSILINAIASGKPDAKGQTQERLLKKARTLMGQQCVRNGNQPEIWELAALISKSPLDRAAKLVKARRALTVMINDWNTKPEYIKKALQLCLEICESTIEAITQHTEDETELMIDAQLNSSRLACSGCLKSLEGVTHELTSDCQEILKTVNNLVEEIIKTFNERTSKRNGPPTN